MHTVDDYYLADVPYKDFGFSSSKEFLKDFLSSIQEMSDGDVCWTFYDVAARKNRHPLLKLFVAAISCLISSYLNERFNYNSEDGCYYSIDGEEIPQDSIDALRYWAINASVVKAAVYDSIYVAFDGGQLRRHMWKENIGFVTSKPIVLSEGLRDMYAIRQVITSLRVRYEVTQSISNG